MLYLYDKNTIDFTNNGEPIRHSYDEHVVRSEGFYLTFKLLLDFNREYKNIKKEMIISAETPDGRNQFRVYDIVKRKDHVEVVAVQLMYDLDNKMVNPFKVNNVSGTTVINRFISSFKSSLGAFTLSSSVAETHDFSTNDENDDTPSQNALEVLNRITNRWDSELLVNGYDIRMIKRLGTRTNALLYEKKNISNFEDESTVRNMATRIHATSRFIAKGDDEETVISVSVDSPLINEYAQVYEKSFVNNDARTTQELVNWVNLKYSTENIDKPKRNINVSTNIIDGTEINYGDELVLKYLVHDVDEVIRCVGYDYNPVAHTYYSITLGGWKDSFATTLTGGIVDVTQRQVNQIKKNVTHILMNADGYHRNAYGPESVPNPINGDVWYYFEWERPNEIEMRIFEDGFWVPVPFGTKAEVEAAISEAESAKQAAEDAYSGAVEEAGRMVEAQSQEFSSDLSAQKNALESQITTGFNNAVTAAQNKVDALSQSVTNEINSRTTTLRQEIAAAKSDAIATANAGITSLRGTYAGNLADMNAAVSGTKTQADKAVNNINAAVQAAGFTDLSASLTGIKGIANAAQENAQTGIANAATALSNANSALSQLTGVSGKITTVEKNINDLTGQMSLKITSVEAQNIAQAAVDGINIGDRNIIKDSGVRYANANYSINFYDFSEKPVPGEEYTIVLKGEIDTSINTGFYINIETGIAYPAILTLLQSDLISPNLYSKTFIMPELTDYLRLGVYSYPIGLYSMASVDWIKLVKGNRASMDWTPAPEDVEAKVTSLSASLSIESDKIVGLLTRVTNNETVINNVKSTADGTLQTVANQAGKITILETNVNGLNVTVADKASKAELAVVANGVSSTVQSAIDDLEIGGRNYFRKNTPIGQLVPNSSFLNRPEYAPNGFSVIGNSTGSGAIRASNLITGNGWWTVSFDVRGTQSVPVSLFVSICDLGYTKVVTNGTNTFERRSVTVEVTNYGDGSIYNFVDFSNINFAYFFVDNIKVEKGAKATDWTPAPEDMATESLVTQLADNINLRIVEKGNVVAQFNIDNGTTLIQNGKILLDGDTYIMGTTFANDIKAKSMEAVNANIGTLKTNILTSDSITSTMLKTDAATINKLFATDAMVNTLTAKAAFITSVQTNALTAVNADVGNLRTKILTADVITSVHLKVDSATITKLMTNNLLVNTLIADTTMTNSMKTNTLSAITANITSVRSQILVTDVVTATHIKADTALINTIFATDALITTLTSKTAFINSIKAINISADTVTTGTLNGANVNIINLNVSKLVGNISNFVQSAWNTINSTVSITGDGIVSSNSAGRFVHYTNGGLVFGGGGERTVLRNNTGANPNRSGISLEPVGSSLNAIDLDIATRGTSSFHMGVSDLDQGYRLRLSNDDFNTNNYYISLKTGTRFDFRLNSNASTGTNKNNLEIEVIDASGSLRVGKNAGYGSSMYIVGDDVIFAKGGTANRVPVHASLFAGRAFNYIEGNNVYSVEKTISAIIGWIGSAVKWQTP